MAPLYLLIACGPPLEKIGVATSDAILVPFVSETPEVIELNQQNPTQSSISQENSASSIGYAIVAGDTLLGIAERNGISLDNLLVANPGIDARFLTIGQEILIPLGDNAAPASIESSTPIDLNMGIPNCFESAAGELWCYVTVENNQDFAMENVAAQISVFSSVGELVTQKEAISTIQKLDSGGKIPLIAYWAESPLGWTHASSQIINAFRLDDPLERYLDLQIEDLVLDISDSGLAATVSGEVSGENLSASSTLWILAVAYDNEGLVVGTRKLETKESEFELELFSLGPMIKSVDVLLEGRP